MDGKGIAVGPAAASSSIAPEKISSLDALPSELLLIIAARLVEDSPRGVPSTRSLASLISTCTTLRDTSFSDVVAAAARRRWQTNGIWTVESLFLLTTLARQRIRLRVAFQVSKESAERGPFWRPIHTGDVRTELRTEELNGIHAIALLLRRHPRVIACVDAYGCGCGDGLRDGPEAHRASQRRAESVAAAFLACGAEAARLELRSCGRGGAVNSGWKWRADEARVAEAACKHGYADIFLRVGEEVLPPTSEDWRYHAVRASAMGRVLPPQLIELDAERLTTTPEFDRLSRIVGRLLGLWGNPQFRRLRADERRQVEGNWLVRKEETEPQQEPQQETQH